MNAVETVIRFCPKCSAKAKATAEAFATPQVCPGCKTKVLFWDVTQEPAGEVAEALSLKPILTPKAIVLAGVVASITAVMVLVLFFIGFVGLPFTLALVFLFAGGYSIAILLAQQYKVAKQAEQISKLINAFDAAREQQIGIAIKYSTLQDNFQSLVSQATQEATTAKTDFEAKSNSMESEFEAKKNAMQSDYNSKLITAKADFDSKTKSLETESQAMKARIQSDYNVRLEAAVGEIIKRERDAQTSLATALGKINERESLARSTVRSIAIKYLDETKKWLIAKLTTDNLTQTQTRFEKAVDFVEKVGFQVPKQDVDQFLNDIKSEYAAVVRKQLAREEQSRIKEKLREEAKAEADFQREMKRLEQEEKLLERLLAEARAKATEESSAQIEELERRLAEAKEKERALSMAQQTKAGNVYVISNIGSFGEGVFKIGMTRRLEPMDRIKELGDASVPFPFDVHMMIACDNAPKMENSLHVLFNNRRLNKINFRKEFFRVALDDIRTAVEELHGKVEYVVDPVALEFRESINMTDEQFEMVTEISRDVGMDDEDDDLS
jgi:hypothetical protein